MMFGYGRVQAWDGENMLNPLLQRHPAFIPIELLDIIWDFRLRPPASRGLRPGGILDLWNRYALSI